MVAFIIFLVLCYIASMFFYNNRDKSIDYQNTASFKNLPAENKLIIDFHNTILKKVNTAKSLSTVKNGERILIVGAIEEFRKNIGNNIFDISRQYKIDPIIATSILNNCCDDAIIEYLK
jgi:hypothetical protein